MSQSIAEFLKPPQAVLDERIEAEVLRVFCDAGGRFREHAHRRLGTGDLCQHCGTFATILARQLWGLADIHGATGEIRDRVNEHIAAMKEGVSDGA